jgi:hypothetical protein
MCLFDLCPIITKSITVCKKGLLPFTERHTKHEKQTKFWHGIMYKGISERLIYNAFNDGLSTVVKYKMQET